MHASVVVRHLLVFRINFSDDIVGVHQTGQAGMPLCKNSPRRKIEKIMPRLFALIAGIVVGLAVKSALGACLLGMVEQAPLLHFAAASVKSSVVPAKQIRVT